MREFYLSTHNSQVTAHKSKEKRLHAQVSTSRTVTLLSLNIGTNRAN